jgi:putative PIN family toxin of toxin-antitoxin system
MVSTEILREYKEVLSRPKFKLTQSIIEEWWFVLETVTRLVEVNNVVDFPRDRKDAKFLACALATDADFLLTGDRDFTEAKIIVGKTRIISVSLFKRLLIDREDWRLKIGD